MFAYTRFRLYPTLLLACFSITKRAVNPKMQNGHYPENECFIAKKKQWYKHKSSDCKHEKRGI